MTRISFWCTLFLYYCLLWVHGEASYPNPGFVTPTKHLNHEHSRKYLSGPKSKLIYPLSKHNTIHGESVLWLKQDKKGTGGGSYESKPIQGYNDDAFGLVFLTTGLGLKDFQFGAIFLALSGIAASYIYFDKNNNPRFEKILPGLVALVSLIVKFGLTLSEQQQIEGAEILVCFISLAWSIWNYQRADDVD